MSTCSGILEGTIVCGCDSRTTSRKLGQMRRHDLWPAPVDEGRTHEELLRLPECPASCRSAACPWRWVARGRKCRASASPIRRASPPTLHHPCRRVPSNQPVFAFGSGRAMLRRSCKTSRTVTTPPTLLSHPFATVLQLVHDGLFRSSPYAAARRPGGPPVCSGLAHGAETRALVVTEGHCCCALAAQAFCARSSGWSRCSCSRPWPSVRFSCAPLLLNTHVTRTHLRTAPSTTL